MTLEKYKAELKEKLAAADGLHLRDKNGEAYQVLVRASKDKELGTSEWAQLSDLFYTYRRL